MLPIALQVYSVRWDAEKDLPGAMRSVKALGYDGVELAGLYGNDPKEIKAWLADIGLPPISAHISYADMMAAPEKVLGDYALIGCKYAAIPNIGGEYLPGGEKYGDFVGGIEKLGAIAKSLGMQLLYHNHDFEFAKLDGKYLLDILYEAVPADLLQTEIDTCWAKVAGLDPAAYVEKYSGRAPVVHLKDFAKSGGGGRPYELIGEKCGGKPAARDDGSFEFRPIGKGQNDIPAILAASEKAGAKWLVVEQDQPSLGKSPLENAEMSLNYLRGRG
ncbi:MAG: sugar phosphate isomerase/epimerase [Clostridiales bacterium]|jgi:sugar phosphate isomerase/epimerase|nr:sugar phosphate isomerase/epimerase [Clostridiales bacterium]